MTGANVAAPEAAAELVRRLFVLLKAASVYGPDNEGYRAHSAAARSALDALLAKEPAVGLEAREEVLYFNGAPIPFHLADAGARFLMSEMRRRGVGSVEFRSPRAAGQLDAFVDAFRKAGSLREGAFDELRRLLRAAGATAIVVEPPGEPDDGGAAAAAGAKDGGGSRGPSPSGADAARRVFSRAVRAVEELMSSVRAGREADFEEPKRVVQGLAEQVIADAQALFELSLLQHFDEYTYAHCVNVCVYSVAIGDRLGLSRERLAELGFAALFHDVGKAKLPLSLIDKPDAFDDEDWRLIRLHPALGAKALLAMRRPLDGASARAIAVAFEHHLGASGSGYPKLAPPRRRDLFSRICAVADAFDAMTSGRVYSKRAMSPDEALRRMVQGAGTAFDPLLLRVFINAAGIFPIGTAVLLDGGERAVVSRNSPGNLLRPQVVVLEGANGGKSRPKAVIRRTLDPSDEGIDAAAVLRARPATEPPRSAPSAAGPTAPPRR